MRRRRQTRKQPTAFHYFCTGTIVCRQDCFNVSLYEVLKWIQTHDKPCEMMFPLRSVNEMIEKSHSSYIFWSRKYSKMIPMIKPMITEGASENLRPFSLQHPLSYPRFPFSQCRLCSVLLHFARSIHFSLLNSRSRFLKRREFSILCVFSHVNYIFQYTTNLFDDYAFDLIHV